MTTTTSSRIIAAALAALLLGCRHLPTLIHAVDRIDIKPPSPTTPSNPDEADFASLVWSRGGFSGAAAVLDTPRIDSLAVRQNEMTFAYRVDLSSWGYGHHDHTGALACLFTLRDGKWEGGKFDWISSSRSRRDFHNIRVDHYFGWRPAHLDQAEAYAFVIVSSDGRRRSNVIVQRAHQ